MPGYRVEISPNNRAGCKNKECIADKVKILKGEIRFATLVTIKEHTSWTYKHWGCVTPVQIENLKEFTEGDLDLVDGYDELTPEAQAKVDYALKHGHVHDEDWKGDVQVNRPGQKGFRVKASKKKSEEPRKKRGGAVSDDEDDEAPAPAPKKSRKRGKAVSDDEDDEAPAPAPKKSRKRGKAVSDDEDDEAPAPGPKKGRSKASAAPNPTRGKKATSATTTDADKPAPQKRGRKRKVTAED